MNVYSAGRIPMRIFPEYKSGMALRRTMAEIGRDPAGVAEVHENCMRWMKTDTASS